MEHESSIYTGYYFPRDARTWAEWKKPWGADVPTRSNRVGDCCRSHDGGNKHARMCDDEVVLTPSRPLIEPDVLFPPLTFPTAAYYLPSSPSRPFFPHCLRTCNDQHFRGLRVLQVWWKRYDASIRIGREKNDENREKLKSRTELTHGNYFAK